MTLSQRVEFFTEIFDLLQSTTSLNHKRAIVNIIPEYLKEDFEYILEVLNGIHKFGYTYEPVDLQGDVRNEIDTVKDVLQFLQEPMLQKNLSLTNIQRHTSQTYPWRQFFEPIVNRTLKLGIGKSLLPKDGLSPMLAKKFEGKIRSCTGGYFLTEKLDGNRCIARYDGEKWIFTSRNGKVMNVQFDMSGLPKEYVYDGEILAPKQVEMSMEIYKCITSNAETYKKFSNVFNETSGLINRHSLQKQLVYNIFDIMTDDAPYVERRLELNRLKTESSEVRVVPMLAYYKDASDLNANIGTMLDKVIDIGGEGLMINLGDSDYMHKRTDNLLKVKPTYTIDMKVTGIQYGTGKYEGMVGALEAVCDKGVIISCKIGTGLSDEQRLAWALRPEEIIGKVIEVGYFSLSQDSALKGSNIYSLRFPRLKRVRTDKDETSPY